MDTLYLVFVVLGFVAVVLFLEGLYLAWNAYLGEESRLIARRLQMMSAGGQAQVDGPSLVRKRLLSEVPTIERLLLQVPRIHRLDRFLAQSGLTLTVASFLGIGALLALIGLSTAWLFGAPLAASVGAAVALALLWLGWVQHRRMQRIRQIESQLPDALDLMARAMLAGHAFSSALLLVGTEGPQPIAQEFKTTFDEINYGVSNEVALQHLAARVASSDLRFFIVAVLIQTETGGNLAHILQNIASLIRERQKLQWTVRVLSAEGRLSAWILSALPFVLSGVIALINPEFIAKLWTDPIGLRMVGASLTLMLIGVWWMWRLVRIRI